MDCCLVNMPFMDVRRPSLALGLLRAALEADGLTARTVYGNLLFCKYGGLPAARFMLIRARVLLGDWVFARAAFPDSDLDLQPFFDYFVQRGMNLADRAGVALPTGTFESLIRLAMHVRTKVDGYLDHMVDRIVTLGPRVVGCSSTFEQHVASLALLRRIRERRPDVVTMMGGANCESIMGVATHRNFPWVDFVVSGEADHLIGPLVRSILSHGRDIPGSKLPAGVFGPVHRLSGYPLQDDNRPPRAVVMDVNSIPVPNYEDYFSTLDELPALKAAIRPALPFQSSRGCWWHSKGGCTFCGFNGQGAPYRSTDPHRVIGQIRQVVQRYGIRSVVMVDTIMDMRYIETLLPLLQADDVTRNCRFYYETKSNLQPRHLRALREAGVTWVQPGIESLSTGLLTLMNKGCQAWQNVQFLKACLKYGLRVAWNVLHGFPLEQDHWYERMAGLMPLLHHLPPPNMFTQMQIQRFSRYHSDPERFGLKLVPLRDYLYIYPLQPQELEQLAFFFDDERGAELALNAMYPFLDGTGLDSVRAAFKAWKKSWAPPESRPVLTITETDGSLLVRDTRKIAMAERHLLSGTEKGVFEAADSGPLLESLTKRFVNQGVAPKEIEEVRAKLVDLKLAIEIDGRLLALAVPEPIRPFPPEREDIRGAFRLDQFTAAYKREN
ncbi:MAG: RiPP maturation radical SAM C-methyltransferase [Acidobacteriota bacterium]